MIDTLFIAAAAFAAGLIDAIGGGAAGAGRGAPLTGIGPTKAPRRRLQP
ncbi:MAG: hypothetical protein KGJ44_10310 [Betaproteobacteria bacterium]|nr:hypothetical protein [Betaproteobacteria bacterium]